MTMTAIHTIHRRDPKTGVLEEISPKHTFEPSSAAERDRLLVLGAAKDGGKAAPKPAAKEPEDEGGGGDNDTAKLDDMTKAQLVSFAKDNGIEIDASASKADVLETIKADLASGEDLV